MAAVAYLVLLLAAGDTIAEVLGVRGSRPRRLGTAFLAGLLATSWLTYAVALALAAQPNALDLANLVTAGVVLAMLAVRLWGRRRQNAMALPAWVTARPDRAEILDWLVIAAIAVFSGWMTFTTYGFSGGELQIGGLVWSDFGPTTAISQSFSLGHNLPTEYPHFAGPGILYHFLFYFQVGNMTHLGLDPALANNLLSVASIVGLLILVMATGRVLLRSASVGRLGALLFFFHGSLAFLPYLGAFASPSEAMAAIGARTAFLPSGFPYRGEEWGIWTQLVFLNQRHLASAMGILFVGLLFVLDRWPEARPPARTPAGGTRAAPRSPASPGGLLVAAWSRIRSGLGDRSLPGYVLVGVLLGMLPLWNGPLFIASAVVFAILFAFVPLRPQLACLAIAAGLVSLPQLAALRPAAMARTSEFPIIHVGYIVDDPTVASVAAYLGFTFGPKLLLAGLALVLGTWRQRLVFGAFTAVLALAFLVQFSVEVFANHKFVNVWLVALNLFAAAGLVRLWAMGRGRAGWRRIGQLASRAAAAALVVVIAAGGIIDLVPIKNTQKIGIHLAGDPLFDWIVKTTGPRDVFLTDLSVTSTILLAGRPIYYGWPYYAWSAGYPVEAREDRYRRILGGTEASEVVGLLQQEGVSWVAIDDGLRHRDFVKNLNEPLLASVLPSAFSDAEGRYGHLMIYRVPTEPVAVRPGTPKPSAPVSMFAGGMGSGPGQFQGPRGIAVASSGDVFVADSDNHRIQRFGADGTWRASIGGFGSGQAQFNQPNGIAIGSNGHLYVADTTNHRVQELDSNGTFLREWRGPEPGFYGPRDIAAAPDGTIFVLDQGRGRVVAIRLDGRTTAFATLGTGDSQLRDPTGLAVVGGRVYVADAANGRLAIFSTAGEWIAASPIPEWRRQVFQLPDVLGSADGSRLFASSSATDQVLVLGLDGERLGELRPTAPARFEAPNGMAIGQGGRLLVSQFYGARVLLVNTTP